MFNFLKNPFEKLTVENQEDMKKNIGELKEYFTDSSKNTIVLGLANIEKELKSLGSKIEMLASKVEKTASGQLDEKSLEKAGKASIMLGDGIESIITSIKVYSKLPESVIDAFVEGMAKIGESFEKLAKGLKTVEQGGKALLSMAKGIFFFGLALLVSGPIYLLALPLSIIVVGVIMGITWLFSKVMGDKDTMDGIEAGGRALAYIALGIILFGLALLVAAPIYQMAMSWSLLLVVGVIVVTVGLMWLLGKVYNDNIEPGIEALMWMALAIVVFGIALVLASKIYEYLWDEQKDGMIIIGLVILAAVGVLYLLSKVKGDVIEGSIALVIIAFSIMVLAVGLSMFSEMFPSNPQNWETLGLIGATIGGLTIAALALGLAGKNVMLGAGAMILLSVAIIVLSFGLNMFADTVKNGYDSSSLGLLMVTIAGLAIEFGIIGIPVVAGLVALGAAAIIVAGVAIVELSYALKEWRTLNYTDDDAKGLQNAIVRIPMAFLGLTGDEGFFTAIKTAAKTADVMIAARKNAYSLIDISRALVSIGVGIKVFRDVTKGLDINSFSENVSGIVTTLANAFGDIGVKYPGGKKSLFASVFGGGTQSAVADGISSVMGMGDALTGIARGMQSMANLKFPTKYDKEGNPIEFESMDSDAPAKVAANAGMITSVLATVFGDIGKKYPGGKKSLFASVFGGGTQSAVADGISAVMGMGSALTGIAQGVQAMADLKFPTKYDKEGKPIEFESINIKEKIKAVSENVNLILLGEDGNGGLVATFVNVGKKNGPDKGWFTSTDYETGVDMIQNVGQPILSLALGVQTMADLKFPTKYDKEGNPIEFTDASNMPSKLKQVEDNIKLILLGDGKTTSGLVGIFKKLGGEDDSGWFSSSTIEKGGEIAKMIAEPIEAIANAANTLMKDEWDSTTASERIKTLINALTSGNGTSKSILYAKAYLWKNAGESYERMGESIPNIINAITKLKPKTVAPFELFIDKATELAKSDRQFQNISESFSDISNSMGTFKDSVNALDIKLLSETKGLFEAMAVISKSGSTEQIISKYGKTLEATFKNLAELLEQFGSKVTQSSEQTASAINTQTQSNQSLNETLKNQKQAAEQAPPAQNAQNGQMLSQLREIATILRGTIKIKDTGGFFG